jgi:hypothetical protein
MSSGVQQENHESALAESEIHDVLRNDRRRLVLEQLAEGSQEETVSDLAEYIASVESGEDPPPRNVRQSVYVSLHQTHLPKLDELGIVEYDASSKTVLRAERADDVAVYMEVVPKNALSWAEYYLALGLLGLSTVVGHVVDVPLLGDIDSTLLAGVMFLVVTLSAGYHILDQQDSLLQFDD